MTGGMEFEWTVRFGDVLTLLGALSVAAGILYRRGRDETQTEDSIKQALIELKEMKVEIKALNEKTSKLNVLEMQVVLLMKWYDELRRGEGFVPERQRRTVDGEY